MAGESWIQSISDFEDPTYFNSPFLNNADGKEELVDSEQMKRAYQISCHEPGRPPPEAVSEPDQIPTTMWQTNPTSMQADNNLVWPQGHHLSPFQQSPSLLDTSTITPLSSVAADIGNSEAASFQNPYHLFEQLNSTQDVPHNTLDFPAARHVETLFQQNRGIEVPHGLPIQYSSEWFAGNIHHSIPPHHLYRIAPTSPLVSKPSQGDLSSASSLAESDISAAPTIQYNQSSSCLSEGLGTFTADAPSESSADNSCGRKRLPSAPPGKVLGYEPHDISEPDCNDEDSPAASSMSESEQEETGNDTDFVIAKHDHINKRYVASSISQIVPCSSSSEIRDWKDDFLVRARQSGLTYKEIKTQGNFVEAESTLRGRFRTLTKKREERVRKPEWTEIDVFLLRKAVRKLYQGKDPTTVKVSWKQVARYISDNGGSYHFGNATCRKKWDELTAGESS